MPTLKLTAGGNRLPVEITQEENRVYFQFPFYRPLMEEIKMMKGAKWHGHDEKNPRKVWSVEACQRNSFQLAYLAGQNPYVNYDSALDTSIVTQTSRYNHSKQKEFPLLKHQPSMIAHLVQRKRCILAGEMGTTKTLSAIIGMEIVSAAFEKAHGYGMRWYYVAPRSALRAVQREFIIWGGPKLVDFMTYEGMTKLIKNWNSGSTPFPGIIFDESSKLKNDKSQRSQCAQALADGIRESWGDFGYVWLMTGTPAPKSPVDWWSQCEIACPGFLKEGDATKLKYRLSIIVQKAGFDGGVYPQHVTWKDNPEKCNVCGELESNETHSELTAVATGNEYHAFVPSINEIEYLYKRLNGLVAVYFKKDCLDLPDKIYRTIELKPTASTLRAAKLIAKTSATVIEGLTRLRELSDGFQYVKTKAGKKTCPQCAGDKEILNPQEKEGTCPNCPPEGMCLNHQPLYEQVMGPCPMCGGHGEVDRFERDVTEVPCPKEQALLDVLDEHEDIGRIVIYAGFTAAVDRCSRICQKAGWHVIRIDEGKERVMDDKGQPLPIKDYLSMFQDDLEKYPRVAFVAHPGSAGMGLTLTASPTILYYSNDFNGEYRSQSEDRIHRPGMDYNRGATIIDLIHLPSDVKVLSNIKAKRNLELMSMGDLQNALAGVEDGERAL